MADDPLEDIANRARLLAEWYPEVAARYQKHSNEWTNYRDVIRRRNEYADPTYAAGVTRDLQHATAGLRDGYGRLQELGKLIYTHLPEVLPLEYIRLAPSWDARKPATDWSAIVAELRRIEDAALVKLYSRPVDKFPNDARDKWIYEQCLDPDTPLKTIITNLAERSEWEPLTPTEAPKRQQAEPPTPHWNRDTGELSYGGKVVKTVRNLRQAKNITTVLNAFQEESWPVRIDDPLPHPASAERTNKTVASLNNNLSGIRFSADGTGQGFRWGAL